jgi:hypothetical protein
MRHQGSLPGRYVVCLVLLLCGVCCLALKASAVKAFEGFEVVRTESFEGVIVPGDKAKEFMKAFSSVEEKETWTPGKDAILKLEERLEAYLKKAAAKHSPKLWTKLAPYKRQYVGLIRNNRRVIFTNFFCDALRVDWKTSVVVVEDGGDCFFTVMFDANGSRFYDLRINGEA